MWMFGSRTTVKKVRNSLTWFSHGVLSLSSLRLPLRRLHSCPEAGLSEECVTNTRGSSDLVSRVGQTKVVNEILEVVICALDIFLFEWLLGLISNLAGGTCET